MKEPTFHDVEQLSAYLDGRLSPKENARLQARLAASPQLQDLLQDLSQSRELLRSLPQRRSPRNFTLSPQRAGIRPPLPRAYPVLRLASGLALALFAFTFLANFIRLPVASSATLAAQAPADTARVGLAPMATAAPTQAPQASGGEFSPTPTPEMGIALAPPQPTSVPPGLGAGPAPTEAPTSAAAAAKAAPTQPSFPAWQAALLGLGLLLAALALLVRWRADRAFARKTARH